jgi:hypothetical protein
MHCRTLHTSAKTGVDQGTLLKLQDAIQDINTMVQVPSSHTLKHQAKCLVAGALLKELIMRAGR